MTKAEIVVEIASRLNLTSTVAMTRLGRLVDRHYLRITTKMGMAQVSRTALDIETVMDIGSAEATFVGMEKVSRVYYFEEDGETKHFLEEVTLDELRDVNLVPDADTPTRWAPKVYTDVDVTILTDRVAVTEYSLFCDGYQNGTALGDDDAPLFPESFHDILIERTLMDEYKKIEKLDLARESKRMFDESLSDLLMWAARSKYLKIQQGGRPRDTMFMPGSRSSRRPW